MKKLQYILLVLVLVLASCNNKDSIWNVMGDMDSRVSTLETLCQEMNTNIAALETLIKAQNNGDYITNVTEIRNGNTIVGYTITFNHHDPITIYNGTNGKDGRDGVDGYKPAVGAKQDTDGIYYWTVDGNWLTDANGNKIRVTGEKGDKGDKGDTGDKGQDGQDGNDGTNGVNGNTPQLKIENNYWYISYDGPNWTQLGKATGADGKDGTNGTNGSDGAKGDKGDKGDAGDTIFRSVTQDDNYVYFTLSDGTLIKLPKNGSSSSDTGGTHADNDIIEFKDLNAKRALLSYIPSIDVNGDGEISFGEARNVKRLYFKDASINKVLSFLELKYFVNLTYYGRASSIISDELGNEYQLELFEISLPDGLDTIGSNAFSYSQLHNLTIPTGCRVIENQAFWECNDIMVSFQEPSQCEYIGYNANVKIQSYLLPNTIKHIGSLGVIYGGKTAYIPESFEGDITNINYDTIIWNAINFQDKYQDYNRGGIGMVYLNSNTTNNTIKSVVFGEKVQNIPDYLCFSLSALTEITIPENVSIIGESAFQKCSSLKKIYCKNMTPPVIGKNAFPNTINIIYVPRQSVSEYRTIWNDYSNKILGFDFE